MVKPEIRKQYHTTIGIECHVQLKTRTKLFSAVGNDARDAAPNTLISHIDLGMPGSLPVLNEAAVELAMRAAFALGTSPQSFSKFDRKHYFYPDLPKGYQITQFDQPIILGGQVAITTTTGKKTIHLTRAHMEEDAGKSSHPAGKDYSLVDLNRAGTPLLEIVSEPEIHTAEEAKAYAQELYLLMRYAGVSEADLYHGNMRFDVNVSVSKESGKLGTRTETKNLNSFRSVEKAVEYEIERQIELLEKGESISQETRGWDDAKQKTFSQRSKEEAHDYRYFPEPDLPPIVLTDEDIEAVKESMPLLPGEWRQRLQSMGLDEAHIETLILAELDDESISYLQHLEKHGDDPGAIKTLANWFVNIEIPLRRDETKNIRLTDEADRRAMYTAILTMISANKLSSTAARQMITDLLQIEVQPSDYEKYAADHGFVQVSDEGEIAETVAKVLADNPQAAEDVRNGEMKAIGFLIGQVMKASQGKANPQLAQSLIKKQLGL